MKQHPNQIQCILIRDTEATEPVRLARTDPVPPTQPNSTQSKSKRPLTALMTGRLALPHDPGLPIPAQKQIPLLPPALRPPPPQHNPPQQPPPATPNKHIPPLHNRLFPLLQRRRLRPHDPSPAKLAQSRRRDLQTFLGRSQSPLVEDRV